MQDINARLQQNWFKKKMQKYKKIKCLQLFIRLMQNEHKTLLNLLSYRQHNGIVLYQFELHHQGQILTWEQRYSSLKQFSLQLPQTPVKFPPKNSIRHVFSHIRGAEEFTLQRFNLLKEYFDSVNLHSELKSNTAFLKIYRHLLSQKNIESNQTHHVAAPVIKGKKLQHKTLGHQNIYIIV